ncbi:hypothetical protein [Paraburkholderia silvatlantica]|uniref:Uncharacterized protein n=1 Tax=Paraburkholderia silvatlantica TaxID=321895 RepID=A0ABR6FLG2_9BURK|nr:hypothetical protein [Paraburkholderia silvatlantica]MBB2927883.1 hypothetical protein [Paraburkholderia silvatlantica]
MGNDKQIALRPSNEVNVVEASTHSKMIRLLPKSGAFVIDDASCGDQGGFLFGVGRNALVSERPAPFVHFSAEHLNVYM